MSWTRFGWMGAAWVCAALIGAGCKSRSEAVAEGGGAVIGGAAASAAAPEPTGLTSSEAEGRLDAGVSLESPRRGDEAGGEDASGETGQAGAAPSACGAFARRARACIHGAASQPDEALCGGTRARLACALEPDCPAFKSCLAEARRAARDSEAREVLAALEAQLAAGHHGAVRARCAETAAAERDPALQRLCESADERAYLEAATEVRALRDAGQVGREGLLRAMELQELGETVGRADEAKRLSAELRVCGRLAAVEERVAAVEAAGEGGVPVECEWARRELKAIDSEWARGQLARVEAMCWGELPRALVKPAVAAVAALRDAGEEGERLRLCGRLRSLGAHLPVSDQEAHRRLCAEAKVAPIAQRARKAAARALAANVDYVPVDCRLALEALRGLGSEWAQAARAGVVLDCYVALGMQILMHRLPASRRVCDPAVRQVLAAVKTYRIHQPQLDPRVKRARAICAPN